MPFSTRLLAETTTLKIPWRSPCSNGVSDRYGALVITYSMLFSHPCPCGLRIIPRPNITALVGEKKWCKHIPVSRQHPPQGGLQLQMAIPR